MKASLFTEKLLWDTNNIYKKALFIMKRKLILMKEIGLNLENPLEKEVLIYFTEIRWIVQII